MELQEISNAFSSRYDEIFDRIDKNISKFAYATDSEYKLRDWQFDNEDKNFIIVNTFASGWGGDPDDEYAEYVECKYLENDEVFEKWLDDKYNKKKAKEIKDAEDKVERDVKRQENFERNLYEKLKTKFE